MYSLKVASISPYVSSSFNSFQAISPLLQSTHMFYNSLDSNQIGAVISFALDITFLNVKYL